jgi:hypothetical protein
MAQSLDARSYLRRFHLSPSHPWTLSDREDLLNLADWYRASGDTRSMLGCVYLYTAIKHPPPSDCPSTVELGREVLDAWLDARSATP